MAGSATCKHCKTVYIVFSFKISLFIQLLQSRGQREFDYSAYLGIKKVFFLSNFVPKTTECLFLINHQLQEIIYQFLSLFKEKKDKIL